ncbi:MAG: cupredoxin domain-containing protein [Candidatus Saccharibacteria bacterium]
MRNKQAIIIVVLVIVLAGAITFFAVHNNNKPNYTNSSQSMNMNGQSVNKAVATSTVAIQNFSFSPMAITVKVGTKVTWTNKDSTSHTVTADSGAADAFDSGTLATGQSYSHTFSKAGTFAYHCTFHSDMHGTVTVTD